MTETSSIGRNEPCPCGSRKKYKRCCGVNAAPKLSAPKNPPPEIGTEGGPGGRHGAGMDPSILQNMDPEMISQVSQAIQRLPKGQMQRLQSIMQRAMSGKDVAAEAEAFEKSLPVHFQNMIRSMSMSAGFPDMAGLGSEASGFPTEMPDNSSGNRLEGPPEGPVEQMTEEQARALVAQAAAEGKISKDQAQTLLTSAQETNPSSSEKEASSSKLGKFWRNISGKNSP